MLASLQIDGIWPGPVTLRKGWGRALARPWNPLTSAGSLRLARGNAGFLAEATEWVIGVAGGKALSPALYPSATRIWERCGYQEMLRLEIMERPVDHSIRHPDAVSVSDQPDLAELEGLDRRSFDRFWHMGAAGLSEAIGATPRAAVLEARDDHGLAGYAIVGAQLGVSFLQRIAVDPRAGGAGLGRALVTAAQRWASDLGAATMILNVRPDNEAAQSLYRRTGFSHTGKQLLVLGYPTDSLA